MRYDNRCFTLHSNLGNPICTGILEERNENRSGEDDGKDYDSIKGFCEIAEGEACISKKERDLAPHSHTKSKSSSFSFIILAKEGSKDPTHIFWYNGKDNEEQ